MGGWLVIRSTGRTAPPIHQRRISILSVDDGKGEGPNDAMGTVTQAASGRGWAAMVTWSVLGEAGKPYRQIYSTLASMRVFDRDDLAMLWCDQHMTDEPAPRGAQQLS